MALVICPECGRSNISDFAEHCPGCGYNVKEYYEREKEKSCMQRKKNNKK